MEMSKPGAYFGKEVSTIDELKKMFFDCIQTTIETLEKQNLKSGEVEFDFKNANVTCIIKLKDMI